jgi:hypothetical protein
MDYELAKELKDAGWGYFSNGEWINEHIPTLSELIEACGEKFGTLGGSKERGFVAVAWYDSPLIEKEHETDMPHCWCDPTKEVQLNGALVVLHKKTDTDFTVDPNKFFVPQPMFKGPTSEEAVARLWLALNPKKS